MAFRVGYCISLVALLAILLAAAAEAAAAGSSSNVHHAAGVAGGLCNGTIALCLAGAEELEMDSEVSRRSLQMMRSYISYKGLRALQAAGNARSGLRYNRGCQTYNRCRQNTGSY